MEKTWSNKWVGSKQPRKQRKYRANAPLHRKHKLVSAHLEKTLRGQYKTRALPVRKGDEIEVMRGAFSGRRGIINRVDLRSSKIYIEGLTVKKSDGSEAMAALQPSNLKITKLNTDDKERKKVLDRVFESKTPKVPGAARPRKTASKKETGKTQKEKPEKENIGKEKTE